MAVQGIFLPACFSPSSHFSSVTSEMAGTKRLLKSLSRLVLPVFLLLGATIAVASIWLVHEMARPESSTYLVTPQKYGELSARGARITDVTWSNADGTTSRGWLLRGEPNQPAVVVLYRYGANRSHVLNMAVKINEATNFTILMPELRGHGENPSVAGTSFGGCEAGDIAAAVTFLKSQRTPEQIPLVSDKIGVYGLELGALTALLSAAESEQINALALDSAPHDSNAIIARGIERRFPFMSAVTSQFAQVGTYAYYYDGCFSRVPACDIAKKLNGRDVLLLAGVDQPDLQSSTSRLAKCFPPSNKVSSSTDLSPSGMGLTNASLEISEAYEQRVIDFFRNALTN